MKNKNPIPKYLPKPKLLLPTGKKHHLMWLWISTSLLILIGVTWLVARPLTNSHLGCLVGDQPKFYANQPSVNHMYEGEDLKYTLRDGSYVPTESVEIYEARDGHKYSLKVDFKSNQMSPAVGSTIAGTLTLLQDGKPIKNIPRGDNGEALFSSAVGIGIHGIPGRQIRDFNSFLITPNRLPYSISHIYSGQVTNNYLDISRGVVDFEFIYFGKRTSPYLEFRFGNRQMTTDKVVCFSDQDNLQIVLPTIDKESKGDFYYEVNVSPASVSAGHSRELKLEIISRITCNNRVNTNPYQRVTVWAYEYIDNINQSSGEFNDKMDSNDIISKTNLAQLAGRSDYSGDRLGSAVRYPRTSDTIYIDLIKGRGTVHFSYSGAYGVLNPFLTFVVQPTNYDIGDVGDIGISESYRIKNNIQLPTKPKTFSTTEKESYWRETELTLTPKFLYQTWMPDNSIMDQVYTIATVQLSSPGLYVASNTSILGKFLPVQISKVILATILIWFLARKRKTKITNVKQ